MHLGARMCVCVCVCLYVYFGTPEDDEQDRKHAPLGMHAFGCMTYIDMCVYT